MPNLLDFLPIFQETAASIRARMDADANAGLDPDDPRYIDTREGGFYFDVTQTALLEIARLWDALAFEVPAASFPQYAWGEYLDYHAEVFGLSRKSEAKAAGEATFTGTPGATVPAGTPISADPADEDEDEIEFVTTEEGTLSAGLTAVASITPTPSEVGGNLPGDDYYYTVTAINAYGETDSTVEVLATVDGPTAQVVLDWPDVTNATGYRIYRRTDTSVGFRVGEVTGSPPTSSFTDTGAVSTGVEGPPDQNTTAGVTVAIEASVAGVIGNVAAYAIRNLVTGSPTIATVVNTSPTSGGAEVESDEALRERIILMYQGAGGGNVNDYRRWALEEQGVGRVFVNPIWQGAGTVQVVIMDANGDPMPDASVDALQTRLDPVAGQGMGLAPIGATVTVQTPVATAINIAGTITFEAGYNLDGSGGLIGLASQITDALSEYIDQLEVGEDVIYDHVKAQFFRVPGVYTVSNVTVNSGTSNVSISADPPYVAQLGSVTLA